MACNWWRQFGDLSSRHVQSLSREFFDEVTMEAGSFGLLFERAQLTPNFGNDVFHSCEVAVRCGKTTFGAVLTLAVLQDTGGFFDNRSPILGVRGKDRVDLSLRDNHMLLPSDSTVAQQL